MTAAVDVQALVEEARRLDAEATPGPWRECGNDRGGCVCGLIYGDEDAYRMAQAFHWDHDIAAAHRVDDQDKRNAAFIARARALLPDLADALAATARERDRLAARVATLEAERAPGREVALSGEVIGIRPISQLAIVRVTSTADVEGWTPDGVIAVPSDGFEKGQRVTVLVLAAPEPTP